MTRTTSGDPGRYLHHRTVGDASPPYLARVRTDQAEVFRDDSVRVDAFVIPHGSSLRQALGDHGWRPTGHRVPGRGWGAILVEPIRRH
ncbi:MAG: hypothetical protein ACRDPQ_11005 [Nocardioidaceae bacterium]